MTLRSRANHPCQRWNPQYPEFRVQSCWSTIEPCNLHILRCSPFSPRPKCFYNESNFNDESIAEVREEGREAGQYDKYYASKAIAEKTAWSFVSDHKSDITWELSVVCPIYVFEPVLREANSPADLNSSSAMFYDALVAKDKKATLEDLVPINCDWVDVRDAALGHIRALEVPKAEGDRFILSSGPSVWQDWQNEPS